MSYAAAWSKRLLNTGKHIVINSTVMPGYIKNTATFLLRDCKACSVSYNPAFVAQGEVMRGYRTGGFFHMVLIGAADDEAFDFLEALYLRIVEAGKADGGALASFFVDAQTSGPLQAGAQALAVSL